MHETLLHKNFYFNQSEEDCPNVWLHLSLSKESSNRKIIQDITTSQGRNAKSIEAVIHEPLSQNHISA